MNWSTRTLETFGKRLLAHSEFKTGGTRRAYEYWGNEFVEIRKWFLESQGAFRHYRQFFRTVPTIGDAYEIVKVATAFAVAFTPAYLLTQNYMGVQQMNKFIKHELAHKETKSEH